MPAFELSDINWLAVLVAAFVTFMLGGLWYTALFGRTWQRLHGYSEADVKALQAKRPPPVFFGTMLACYLVMAVSMAIVVQWTGASTLAGGAAVGLVLWLGFAGAIGLTGAIAVHFPVSSFAIDALYQLIYCVASGALLAAWT